MSTDGFNGYANAVEFALGGRVDYAQVVKDFGNVGGEEGRRYAPPRLIGQEKIVVSGTFGYYNFVRMHKTLRMTPAMAAGVENGLWSLGELVDRTTK